MEQQEERFKIEDINGASWAFRKLKEIEDDETEIKLLASEEEERIKHWRKKELDSFKNSKGYFESLIEEYYRELREVDPKAKISTPYGKASSRKQQSKWNYEEDKTLNWLKANNTDLIRTKEEVNKSELKKKYKIAGENVVNEDGEIIDGITIEEREDKITIKVER